jgi:hypothetical protein
MYCNKCGNELGQGSIFCAKCGQKVATDGNAMETADLAKKNDLNLGVAFIVSLLIVVAIFLAIGGKLLWEKATLLSSGEKLSGTYYYAHDDGRSGDYYHFSEDTVRCFRAYFDPRDEILPSGEVKSIGGGLYYPVDYDSSDSGTYSISEGQIEIIRFSSSNSRPVNPIRLHSFSRSENTITIDGRLYTKQATSIYEKYPYLVVNYSSMMEREIPTVLN